MATEDEALNRQVDVWKKIVDVQQHFNDIELRIRNLCLTILGALFGAAAYSIASHFRFAFMEFRIPAAAILFFVAIIVVFEFWIMDRHWYHNLLIGAVEKGEEIEAACVDRIPGIDLARTIRRRSQFSFLGRKIRARDRLDLFYFVFFDVSCSAFLLSIVRDIRLFWALVAMTFVTVVFYFYCLEEADKKQ